MGPVAGAAKRKVDMTKREKKLARRRKDFDAMKETSGYKRPGSYSK